MSGATLFLGDASSVLPAQVPGGSIDMVYSDPPYGTGQVWKGTSGSFDDRWSWNAESAAGWDALHDHSPAGAGVLAAVTPDKATRAYLGAMARLLLEVRRTLRPTGTLWLQFDDTMGAHLRLLCDAVFGPQNAFGTVIWKRTSSHGSTTRRFGRVHDTIACYGRSPAAVFRLWRCSRPGGLVVGDPLDPENPVRVEGLVDDHLNPRSLERVGYPTQKPVSLISRFIQAATLPDDVVLDPTCGSGTTVVAAMQLGRRAIGIDRSSDALAVTRERLGMGDLFTRVAA